MSVTKDLERKLTLIPSRDEALYEAIRNLEGDLYRRLIKLLGDLDTSGGGFLSSDRNISMLSRFSTEVEAILTSGDFNSAARTWASTFDDIDELNGSIFNTLTGQITTDTIGSLVGPVREGLVNDLVSRLTDYPNLRAEIALPLRQTMMRNIILGTTYKEAEQSLRLFLGQDPERLGHINRWAIQLTRDSLNQYDGASQKKIADDIGLDAFMFVGSLQDNSRLGCRHMVKAPAKIRYSVTTGRGKNRKTTIKVEENRFADIVMQDGGFRMEDIPIIIERNQGDSGWNPNTTENTYLAYRNGYNCNHNAVPYLADDGRQSRILKEAQNDLT